MTQLILQSVVSGILVGGMYGLVALGLALAFGVLKVLNVAHGGLVMLGGYASFFAFTFWGLDPFASMPLVFVVTFLFGAVLNFALFRYVTRTEVHTRIKNSLLISFGLALVLQALAVRFFTADERTISTTYSLEAFTIGSVRIPVVRLAGLVVALVAAFALEWLLARTRFGRALRATSEDWTRAALTGVNVRQVYLIAFAISAALAGISGSMVSLGYSVSPNIGLGWTLNALIVVVLAGLGSMRGLIVAGIFLGLVESLAAVWIGGQYREVAALVLFLVILSFRPQGFFGRAHA
ncbi:MAG: branched-chain amino acid ABC transporter permease [Acidimicrobiia bacterium]